MSDRPETSTVRAALQIVAAVEQLTVYASHDDVEAVASIIAAARELRPHQVDDVLDFLTARADDKDPPEPDDG